jgi:hypothetical protein
VRLQFVEEVRGDVHAAPSDDTAAPCRRSRAGRSSG